MKTLKKILLGAAAAATLVPAAAHAGSADGKFQIKVLATVVDPNGKIDGMPSVDLIAPGAIGTVINTKANTNVVPTIAAEMFLTPNVSVETICCLTQHHVNLTGAVTGVAASQVLILPATVTAKLHLPLGPIKPYVGVGPSVFFFLKDKVGATAALLGARQLKVKDKIGVAFQAGVDVPINDKGMSLTLDAKKYLMRPTAVFTTATGVEALKTKLKLDPWVLSAGVAYRF